MRYNAPDFEHIFQAEIVGDLPEALSHADPLFRLFLAQVISEYRVRL